MVTTSHLISLPVPARGRLRLSDEDRVERLDDGWWWAGSGAGQWASPLEVMRLSQGPDWHPAERLASVAEMLRQRGLAAPPEIDRGDWWMCRPLRRPDAGPWIVEFDGLAGPAELWLHEVALGRERQLLAGTDGRVRHRIALPACAEDAVLWLCLRARTGAAAGQAPWVGAWRGARLIRPALRTGAPALRVGMMDERRGAVVLRLQVREPLRALTMRLSRGGRSHEVALAERGEGFWAGQLEVESPDRWWPHALGEPALHRLTLHAQRPDGHQTMLPLGPVGFRTLALSGRTPDGALVLTVNGRSLPLRCAVWSPPDPSSGREQAGPLRDQVARARRCGVDLLHVPASAGVDAADALLDACDAEGMLLGHDLCAADPVGQQLMRWQGRAALALVRTPADAALAQRIAQALPEAVCRASRG